MLKSKNFAAGDINGCFVYYESRDYRQSSELEIWLSKKMSVSIQVRNKTHPFYWWVLLQMPPPSSFKQKVQSSISFSLSAIISLAAARLYLNVLSIIFLSSKFKLFITFNFIFISSYNHNSIPLLYFSLIAFSFLLSHLQPSWTFLL